MKEKEIIEELYKLYEQKMYYIAYSILRDQYAAEDAVQDAFVKLIRNVHKVRSTESNGTKRYIIKLVQNAAIDVYRKRKKDAERLTEKAVKELDIKGSDMEDEVLCTRDIRERLAELPSGYREVIILRDINGMSFAEIAEKKGSTIGAVRRRYERGIRLLKGEHI